MTARRTAAVQQFAAMPLLGSEGQLIRSATAPPFLAEAANLGVEFCFLGRSAAEEAMRRRFQYVQFRGHTCRAQRPVEADGV
jgi:hypothetical protein